MSLSDALADQSAKDEPVNKGSIDITPDGATVNNVVVDSPVNDDWSTVFALFNLSAEQFEVVGDTVRMSTWQQSRRSESGDRDAVQLYSYSARFRRKPKQRLSDDEVAERRAEVRKWRLPTHKTKIHPDTPVGAVINLADIQGGKSAGGGVEATQRRLLDGLENVQEWLDQAHKRRNITEVAIVNNGDPMENCAGNYASQLFTVELNLREQMNFVLDHWQLYAKTLYPQFHTAQFVSVLCNHGEFGRMGEAKAKTGDSDNAGGFLAETLRRVLAERPEFDHVQWTIPHDEMTVYPTVANVPMAFNHGHKINGNGDATAFEKWLNGQVRTDPQAHAAKVWVTAHRHNFQCWDLGSQSAFQCPSLDGGSKWYRDTTGRWANSGIIAFLVGEHHPLGWSDLAFL